MPARGSALAAAVRAALARWQGRVWETATQSQPCLTALFLVSAVSHTRPNHSPVSLQRPVCRGPPTVPRSRSYFLSLVLDRRDYRVTACVHRRAILRNASRTMKKNVSPKIDGKADLRWISVVHDRHPPLPMGKRCCLCEGSPKTSVLSSAPNLHNSSKKNARETSQMITRCAAKSQTEPIY